MRRLVRLSLLCGLAVIVSSSDADACSCALVPTCAAFSQADAVFVGVAEVVPTGKDSQRAHLRIEEVFRSDLSKGSVIKIAGKGFGGSCDFEFRDGSRYIVYARNLPDRGWSTTFCSRTKLVDEASEDLEFVRRIAADSRGPDRVEGSAWIAERDARGEAREVSPLAETSVSLRSDTHAFTVETDPRGVFTFEVFRLAATPSASGCRHSFSPSRRSRSRSRDRRRVSHTKSQCCAVRARSNDTHMPRSKSLAEIAESRGR